MGGECLTDVFRVTWKLVEGWHRRVAFYIALVCGGAVILSIDNRLNRSFLCLNMKFLATLGEKRDLKSVSTLRLSKKVSLEVIIHLDAKAGLRQGFTNP